MKHVIIFGITGGVGNAIAGEFLKQHDAICIYAPSRSLVTTNAFNLTSSQQIIPMDWNSDDESSLMAIGQSIKNDGVSIDYCISALGGLHSDTFKPEKKLGQLSADQMMWYYHVNTVLHALIIKTMAPLMAKKSPSIMGFLI
jgi:short-subunit dehydrogenase